MRCLSLEILAYAAVQSKRQWTGKNTECETTTVHAYSYSEEFIPTLCILQLIHPCTASPPPKKSPKKPQNFQHFPQYLILKNFYSYDDYIEYFCLRMPIFFWDWRNFKQLLPRRYGFCLNLDVIKDRVQIETIMNKWLSWNFKINLAEVKGKEYYL